MAAIVPIPFLEASAAKKPVALMRRRRNGEIVSIRYKTYTIYILYKFYYYAIVASPSDFQELIIQSKVICLFDCRMFRLMEIAGFDIGVLEGEFMPSDCGIDRGVED